MKLSGLPPLSRGILALLTLAGGLAAAPRQADAFWLDGDGFYGMMGSTETKPAFSDDRGTYQAIQQTFLLNGEARLNDQSSMYFRFHLFDNPRAAYLGDVGEPRDCPASTTGKPTDPNGNPTGPDSCLGQHQSTGEPGYKSYTPHISEAYIRYAFDWCVLEAGRRGRDWGLGIFLDSGSKPFDTDESVYDGFNCDINLTKTQTLGFSIGYDKLSETGRPVDTDYTPGTGTAWYTSQTRGFGPNDPGDDLDQYYFTIQYDDRKANAGATFTKQIGVYFAQVTGKPYKVDDTQSLKEDGGDGTDLKFLDLFTGFYLGDLSFKNEVLFRMGKSADPNWMSMGGEQIDPNTGEPAMNKLDSIGFAGSLEWTIAHSGAPIGPAEFGKGDASRHVLFFDYAYAPGDSNGYYHDQPGQAAGAPLKNPDGSIKKDASGNPVCEAPATSCSSIGQQQRNAITQAATALDRDNRSSNVKGMSFNRNFKPALLLFNAHPDADDLIVDGVFNPSKVENVTEVDAGYRFESMEYGDFEVKFITASLNEVPPQALRTYYDAIQGTPYDDLTRPVGYYGKSLGYELDLTYGYKFGKEAEVGAALGGAAPGKAWQVNVNERPANDFVLETYAVFHF